jgi:glucan 1,6-alpha-isomaltosidase
MLPGKINTKRLIICGFKVPASNISRMFKFLIFCLVINFSSCKEEPLIIDPPESNDSDSLVFTVSENLRTVGPRYWTPYEDEVDKNKHMAEERWKRNIDWIAANFRDDGYDMICNDGWIEAAQSINAYGYITKLNSAWENEFDYWSDYISAKGLKMGIYYNPMWLTKAAYEANLKLKGSQVHTQDIVGNKSFNDALYFVDVNKSGAREWIQNYVQHFRDYGAVYLRVDFLSTYEGYYGTESYEKAISWIREACGTDIFLSLVMPNCWNHAETELLHGDMLRISDDCWDGDWEFVSERRRGEKWPDWPQYGNAFDGFVAFADIGGHGQMILDGDFMRLNKLSNDNERIFLFSMNVLAGSALAIADQYDTHDGCMWIYKNPEMLDLHTRGLVCKPLSYNIHDVENSSRWIGQLPDGDWIVGLFNRESTTQNRSIDLQNELGLPEGKTENIRDLWLHNDLGPHEGSYSLDLEAHECQILKISNSTYPRFEAELSSMIGACAKYSGMEGFSGPGYVSGFDQPDSRTLVTIEVARKANYQLLVKYYNTGNSSTSAALYTNGDSTPHILEFPLSAGWTSTTCQLELSKGVNYINIQKAENGNGLFYIDFIQIINN